MTFGPIFFAAPWALLGLVALPALYWIIRAAPPPPKRAVFPPLRLLMGLSTDEETRKRAPLWLVLLRALIAALLVLGFARPSLAPVGAGHTLDGPVLIVIDDGWTSAPRWAEARAAASAAAADADRAGVSVTLLLTAPQRRPATLDPMPAAEARGRIARLEPQAWRPDRADALKRLEADAADRFARVVWISDGLDSADAARFGQALAARGPLAVRTPEIGAKAIVGLEATADGLVATLARGPRADGGGALAVETREGRSLASAEFRFPSGGSQARAEIALPPEIAARAARVRIVGEESAGAVRLMGQGFGRPLVGLVDPGAAGDQALLSELFYVERAIAPFATARRGGVAALLQQGAQALVLPDASRIPPDEREALTRWLERGGLLVRFAGPRLANAADDFTPVRLRPGSRSMGGALAWEKPQSLAAFAPDSPFAGLEPPTEVTISRQVLAEPTAEREARVWARLQDGAPVVTAAPRGQGLIVLFHVTAGPDWSTLPFSGLYVEMLRRSLAFAGRAASGADAAESVEPWRPERLLDGFGAWASPPADLAAIEPERLLEPKAGPFAPPGLYTRGDGASAVVQPTAPEERLTALPMPPGAGLLTGDGAAERDLAGLLLGLAALLLALDLLVSLALAGRLPRLPKLPRLPLRAKATTAAALLLAAGLAFAPSPAAAQLSAADPTLEIRLAYLRTGDARLDRQTEAGLRNLSQALRDRTAVEPGEPVGLDPSRDDLSPYPFIYWAAPDQPSRLPDAAVANLDRYMRLGGLLLLDTRDVAGGAEPDAPGPAAILLQGFDVPPLAPVPTTAAPGEEHVLTIAFYLLRGFPGLNRNARLWAETQGAAASRDGVAALLVGDGSWAAAWAQFDALSSQAGFMDMRPRHELAIRFGVNLVMTALTGNYKTDQVHLPALLDRLGQEGRPPDRVR